MKQEDQFFRHSSQRFLPVTAGLSQDSSFQQSIDFWRGDVDRWADFWLNCGSEKSRLWNFWALVEKSKNMWTVRR